MEVKQRFCDAPVKDATVLMACTFASHAQFPRLERLDETYTLFPLIAIRRYFERILHDICSRSTESFGAC